MLEFATENSAHGLFNGVILLHCIIALHRVMSRCQVPLLRHVIGWIGAVEATQAAVQQAISQGETVAVAPGGIAEMLVPLLGCFQPCPEGQHPLFHSCVRFVERFPFKNSLLSEQSLSLVKVLGLSTPGLRSR